MIHKPKRSQLFWLVIYIIALIIVGVINLEALGIVFLAGSFLAGAIFMEGNEDDHIWVYLMPGVWLVYGIGFILVGLFAGYEYTIGRFNKWLDRDKSDKKRFGSTK